MQGNPRLTKKEVYQVSPLCSSKFDKSRGSVLLAIFFILLSNLSTYSRLETSHGM